MVDGRQDGHVVPVGGVDGERVDGERVGAAADHLDARGVVVGVVDAPQGDLDVVRAVLAVDAQRVRQFETVVVVAAGAGVGAGLDRDAGELHEVVAVVARGRRRGPAVDRGVPVDDGLEELDGVVAVAAEHRDERLDVGGLDAAAEVRRGVDGRRRVLAVGGAHDDLGAADEGVERGVDVVAGPQLGHEQRIRAAVHDRAGAVDGVAGGQQGEVLERSARDVRHGDPHAALRRGAQQQRQRARWPR